MQADRQAHRQADRQTGRHADRQAGMQTGRQADRQTGAQLAGRVRLALFRRGAPTLVTPRGRGSGPAVHETCAP